MLSGPAGTALVLSPHPDDAALSCGASIARATEAGWRVVELVFFAGTPPAHSLTSLARQSHEESGLGDDAVAARIGEDRAAMSVLGAEPRYLTLLDALYRLRPDGSAAYPSLAEILSFSDGPEPEIVASAADAIADAVASLRPRVVLHPLGIGGHVDHRAVRDAAVTVQRRAGADVRWLGFEDVPYVMFPWNAGWQATLVEGRHPVDHEVGDGHWSRKLEAIERYRSQTAGGFGFGPADGWKTSFTDYARALTPGEGLVERFWQLETA